MQRDAFPTATRTTWIETMLEKGKVGRDEVTHHIMELYREGLKAYFLATRYRSLGEVDEFVNWFFADRLQREDFLENWRKSGKRLRHWLINGFQFFLKERCRDKMRDGAVAALPDEIESHNPSPSEKAEAAFGWSCVKTALERTHRICEERGLTGHWTLFEGRHLQGKAYKKVVPGLGVTEEQAAFMTKKVRFIFRNAMRAIFIEDGVDPNKIDDEIDGIIQSLRVKPDHPEE